MFSEKMRKTLKNSIASFGLAVFITLIFTNFFKQHESHLFTMTKLFLISFFGVFFYEILIISLYREFWNLTKQETIKKSTLILKTISFIIVLVIVSLVMSWLVTLFKKDFNQEYNFIIIRFYLYILVAFGALSGKFCGEESRTFLLKYAKKIAEKGDPSEKTSQP